MKNIKSRLINYILINAVEVRNKISDMFMLGFRATGMKPNDLLKATDFSINDLDNTKLEAAFAEIRAINSLMNENYINIRPIKGSNNEKLADIYAEYNNMKYAIEVFNSNVSSTRRKSNRDIILWINDRYFKQGKKGQLENTIYKYGCNKKMLCIVIDTISSVSALNDQQGYLELAKEIYDYIDDNALTVCLVWWHGTDTVFYPEREWANGQDYVT